MQIIRHYSFSLVLSSNLSMKKKYHGWWWPMKGLKKCHDKFKKKKKKILSQSSIISKFEMEIFWLQTLL